MQTPAEAAGSDQQAPAKDMAPGRAARAARTPRKSVRAQGANREGRSEQHEGRGKSDAREGAERTEGRSSGNAGADRHQRNDRGDRSGRKNGNDRNDRHQRHQRNNNREVVPSVNKEDLAKLKVAELRAKAAELDVDVAGLKKAELIDAVYDASLKAEGFVEVEGILDIMQDGYGFLRTNGYLPSEQDCYVGLSTIRRNGLRKGDKLTGTTRPARPNEKYAAVQKVATVNGKPVEELGRRVRFGDLTPVYPDECLTMEHGQTTITARVIDLVSPIGKGQRGLIVSPPKAGKTTILKDIAAAISANNPEVHLMCLLVDERPEEVTDMQRSIKGEVISSTFDMPTENHIQVSELVIERAKRLVEDGRDVVVLLDSLTRLARAYNLAQPASGRILSGGVDSTALYPPKKLPGRGPKHRGRRQPDHPRLGPGGNGFEDGRGHLRGVQGHGQHGAQARPQPGRSPHLPGHRPGGIGNAQGGPAARPAEGPAHLGGSPHPCEHEQHRARHGHAHQVLEAHRRQRRVPHAHGEKGPAQQRERKRKPGVLGETYIDGDNA